MVLCSNNAGQKASYSIHVRFKDARFGVSLIITIVQAVITIENEHHIIVKLLDYLVHFHVINWHY